MHHITRWWNWRCPQITGINYFQIYSTETQSWRDRVRMAPPPLIVGEKEEGVVCSRLTVYGRAHTHRLLYDWPGRWAHFSSHEDQDLKLYWWPWWLSRKESSCNAGGTGDTGSIPGEGRSPGEGNGNPLQYSCLGNPMDRGAWRATVHGVTKN